MRAFVLDASLALEWFSKLPTKGALEKRALFDDRVALVPHLWRFEIMNALTTWQRRGDVNSAQCAAVLHDIMQLPFAVVDEGDPELVVMAALNSELNAYDASYLRAAMLLGEPLATLDRALRKAAIAAGVECI